MIWGMSPPICGAGRRNPPERHGAGGAAGRRMRSGSRATTVSPTRDAILFCGVPVLVVLIGPSAAHRLLYHPVAVHGKHHRTRRPCAHHQTHPEDLRAQTRRHRTYSTIPRTGSPAKPAVRRTTTTSSSVLSVCRATPSNARVRAGRSRVNGVAIGRKRVHQGRRAAEFVPVQTVTVSAGHVFVMGDNRSNSADSRFHQDDGDDGLVPMGKVVGVACGAVLDR